MHDEKDVGEEHKVAGDYVEIKTENGWRYKHRYVAEKEVGRELKDNEVVHHIDGDKTHNHPDNLKILTHEEHSSLHGQDFKQDIAVLRCPECGEVFERQKRQTFLSKPEQAAAFCSHECKGRYYGLGKNKPDGEKYLLDIYKD